VNIVFKSYN